MNNAEVTSDIQLSTDRTQHNAFENLNSCKLKFHVENLLNHGKRNCFISTNQVEIL